MPSLRLFPGGCIYRGDVNLTHLHVPHVLKLHIPIDGSLELFAGAKANCIPAGAALMVPPDVQQAVNIGSPRMLLLIDPEVNRIPLRNRDRSIVFSGAAGGRLRDLAARVYAASLNDESALSAVLSTATDLLRKAGLDEARPLHPRVEAALELFRQPWLRLGHKTIAKRAGISPHYLSHLFTEQIGISAKRYALWLRAVVAFEELGRGLSVSEAAEYAGFHDLPHLSRTARQFFGLSPRKLPITDTKSFGSVCR